MPDDLCIRNSSTESSSGFDRYGMHLDLRIQVMSVAAIVDLVKDMASLGMNTLILEWEASYPFRKHATIRSPYAYSDGDVSEILNACRENGVMAIPLQQCFGHVEYILAHNRYEALRESPRDFSQVCPSKGELAVPIFRDLFEELGETHDSKFFHIGGDESRQLGVCPQCREVVRKAGKVRLYTDYLLQLIAVVKEFGKTPVIWADMLLQHCELLEELPRDVVLMDWNYGWPVDRFGDVERLVAAGFEVWGASAMRSAPDNHSKTCWVRHLNNLRDFVPHARRSGYRGMIQTSWSTSGEYGYLRDSEDVVAKLYPIRRVYPISGFRILMAAFAEAVGCDAPIAPAAFVEAYGRERFSLGAADAKRWAKLIFQIGGDDASQLTLADADNLCLELEGIAPEANNAELAHIQLMLGMAIHGLRVSRLHEEWQGGPLEASDLARLVAVSRSLRSEAQSIDEVFRTLNRALLREKELDDEMAYRQAFLNDMGARIERLFSCNEVRTFSVADT